jgi:phosphate transport system substrate-binding protein
MAFTFGSFQRTVQGVVAVSALAVTFAVSPILTSIAQAGNLKGAGATFPQLLYEEYIKAFQKQNPGIKVSYQSVGSGAGIRQTIAGVVDFGGSDAAMTDAQMGEGDAGKRGILLIPTAGGAVVPVYNVSGVNNLNLSRESLAGIFSGKITKWDDAKIKKDNPGANLPGAKINTVVRADGSGTTFIFTNHLSAVDSYFKGRVGVGTAPKWSNDPLKAKGNAGIGSTVSKTANSIGYVEFSFAKSNGLKTAGVQDASGAFVQPSLENTNEAISSLTFPDNFRVFEGKPSKGYPIAGLTWMMVYKSYDKPETAKDVKTWMKWVLTDGQNINATKDFAKIDSAVAQRALSEIEKIK